MFTKTQPTNQNPPEPETWVLLILGIPETKERIRK